LSWAKDKTVVVIGGSWSGVDMMNFLLRDPHGWDCKAKKVIVVGRSGPTIQDSADLKEF